MTFCVESMSIMCFGAVPRSRDSFHPGCQVEREADVLAVEGIAGEN